MRRNRVRLRDATPAAATRSTVSTPSFWSEQYDLYIQGVGWPLPHPSAQVRRQIGPNAMLRFDLDGDHLCYVAGHQRPARYRGGAPADRAPRGVAAAALADPTKPLAAMLKAKA